MWEKKDKPHPAPSWMPHSSDWACWDLFWAQNDAQPTETHSLGHCKVIIDRKGYYCNFVNCLGLFCSSFICPSLSFLSSLWFIDFWGVLIFFDFILFPFSIGIYYRYFLRGYHGEYIKQLIVITIHFKLITI